MYVYFEMRCISILPRRAFNMTRHGHGLILASIKTSIFGNSRIMLEGSEATDRNAIVSFHNRFQVSSDSGGQNNDPMRILVMNDLMKVKEEKEK